MDDTFEPQAAGKLKICKHCGQPYVPSRSMYTFCSADCKVEYRRVYQHQWYEAQKDQQAAREKARREEFKLLQTEEPDRLRKQHNVEPRTACDICGAALTGKQKRYCSDQCRKEAYCGEKWTGNDLVGRVYRSNVVPREKVCQDCGAVFISHPIAKRCPDCRMAAMAERIKGVQWNAGKSRRIGSTDTCAVCGQPYIVNSGMQRMCASCSAQKKLDNNRACYHRAMQQDGAREKFNERRREKKKAEREAKGRICRQCGLAYVPDGSRRTCCSDACQRERLKEYYRNYYKIRKMRKEEKNDPIQ